MATSTAPELGARELSRYLWRQLTSMRTALVLLLLLALAAVPGSIVPQRDLDSVRANQWADQHPKLAPWAERLGLFEVYASPWFAAIYLLLMISLIGCIVPRCATYWKAWRAAPPRPPKNLSRLPAYASMTTQANQAEALAAGREVLREFGYRVEDHPGSLAAEKGKLREAGNLLFHLSVVVVLLGFAAGSLWGFKGGVIVVEGEGFSNTLTQYDDFSSGSLFAPNDLTPFTAQVSKFRVEFIERGRSVGAARNFSADLAIENKPGAASRTETIAVNHPLSIDGTDVFLIGHGYAPHLTVRDGRGKVIVSGPTVFLPEGKDFRSFGVIKAADAEPTQLALEGELYPTYGFTDETGPFSAFPDAKNPVVSMLAYRGDVGLDSGAGQSVYALDKSKLRPIMKANGKPMRVDLALGQTVKLPDGLGSVTFDSMSRFVRLQVSRTPGMWVCLAGAVAGLAGLMLSLFVRPRRAWVRVRDDAGRTVVELASLERIASGTARADGAEGAHGDGVDETDGGELEELRAALTAALASKETG